MNNKSFLFTLFIVMLLNGVLFVHRAYYLRNFTSLEGLTPNPFYTLSRANGRVLLLNSVLVMLTVLRYTITLLRKFGLGAVLPLDHNIYIHKVIGIMIFIQSFIVSSRILSGSAVNPASASSSGRCVTGGTPSPLMKR